MSIKLQADRRESTKNVVDPRGSHKTKRYKKENLIKKTCTSQHIKNDKINSRHKRDKTWEK